MKKSQLTVFMVLGLVVFIIFGLIFYLRSSIKTNEFTQEKQEVTELFTTQGKYYGYMQSCLDEAAKQGVILVGIQGGVIYNYEANNTKPYLGPYKYDYGQYILPFQYQGTMYNVSYGIYAPDLKLGLEGHPIIPDYPYGLTKLVADPKEIGQYTNPFGNAIVSPLPPLCDYYGLNSPNQTGALYSCETYDSKRKSDNDNIQEYLQLFIAQAFEECVALETLPEFSNTSMKPGNISVAVTFSPSAISVKADYPIVAEFAGQESTLSMQTFHTSINVRLKQMHELAERLIQNDINNIFFNIERDANELVDCKEPGNEANVRCLKQGMQVTKYRDVCITCKKEGKYDDILVIQDNQSMINGKPFVFAFAIENRYPALDLIADINTKVNEEFVIDPKGYDPDEDDHNAYDFMDNRYVYGGWKEDYEESTTYPDRKASDAKALSGSIAYQNSKRNATYTPVEGEAGDHIIQVLVCDNEGLCDYQYINVHVDRLIEPIIS